MYFGELSTCEDVIKLLKITIDRQKITINLNEAIKSFSKDKIKAFLKIKVKMLLLKKSFFK